MSQSKPTPGLQNEQEERVFWEANDSADFVDWHKSEKVVLANLKSSSEARSLPQPQSR